ncbi:DUF2512 family protein [Halobacillus fulvus]|nr:DUF2512 family protein [Halobacillus fulvus]
MEHLKLLTMKFLFSFAILFIILGAGFDVSFGNVLLITLAFTVVTYFIADLLILRNANNTTATISEFVIGFIVIYFMTDALTVGDNVFSATLISMVSLSIFEYFFHQSVARNLDDTEEQRDGAVQPQPQLSTEASEELSPYDEDEE